MAGISIFFVLLIVGLIYAFKFIMDKSGKKIYEQNQGNHKHNILVKKYNDVDINKYSGLLGLVGLSISLGAVLVSFEYPSYDDKTLVDLGTLDVAVEEIIDIPQTKMETPPPPPKVTTPTIVEAPDEEKIQDDIKLELPEDFSDEAVIEDVVMEEAAPEPEEEVEDQIFEIVEESAEPIGGMGAFYGWVGKNLKYPNQAKRMGIEGKVIVKFVVDKDGSINNVEVVRGLEGGLSEEAVRVVSQAPAWKPGKQRGRAVKQRMIIPISFKLQ